MKTPIQQLEKPPWFTSHCKFRTDGYLLLSALLIDVPSELVVKLVQVMCWDDDLPESMHQALTSLNRAGSSCPQENIAEEFKRLFVGLGSGELIPYASWYREKMIQSTPLATIRSDLARLGIVRKAESFESEDHVGALCEIMALLSSQDNEMAGQEQAAFFHNHISPWMPDFFRDLQAADRSVFYRTVGRFGSCFLEGESEYLQTVLHAG